MSVKDRRSSLRVEVEGRARVLTDRDEFAGRCLDLGLDGIALRSTRAARPGELVTLEAVVDGQRLRIDAKLVRRQRAGGEYLLGFSFVELDLDTQRRIEHLVFERLAGSPRAEFMRAFVAHADRVPPPAARDGASERTVVAGMLPVPVISGHTQVVAVGQLPMVDRTVIAPPPLRGETVVAEVAAVLEVDPGVPDDTWLDDEMDTAQFRLLEAAQARERAEREAEGADAEAADAEELELSQLEPDEPNEPRPENTVVVGGFAVQPLVDHTEMVIEGEQAPHQRTLVTTDAPERPLVERTAPLLSGDLLAPPRPHGVPEPVALTRGFTQPVPVEPDALAERTVPFLRDLLLGVRRLESATRDRHASEHTETEIVAPPIAQADAVLRPSLRAMLDAKALLRSDASSTGKRGPRVIVSIPHRKYRRVAPTPWNQR